MRRLLWSSLSLLLGCDSWSVNNPGNCNLNATACGPSEWCNHKTASCEPLDGATFVLGQPDDKTNYNTEYGMSAPQSVALIPDGTAMHLVVGDAGNHRVLIWKDVADPTRVSLRPDAVLGMPNDYTASGNGPYEGCSKNASLHTPWSVTGVGGKLIVGDAQWNRLLVWDQMPLAQVPGAGPVSASGLWGQGSYDLTQPNGGGAVSGTVVSGPRAYLEPGPIVNGIGSRFFVADSANNRVLGFDQVVPTSPIVAPKKIIGQTSFTASGPANSRAGLNSPRAVTTSDAVSGGNTSHVVYVADTLNNRIMGYLTSSINTAGAAASYLFGQSLWVDGNPNGKSGNIGANTLYGPQGLAACSGLLFVADTRNHRVLGFNPSAAVQVGTGAPPANPPAATVLLGQTSFTAATAGPGTMNLPADVSCASRSAGGSIVAVADSGNNRVLLWGSVTTSTPLGQPASVVFGQPDRQSQAANNPLQVSGVLSYNGPQDVASDGTWLAVADTDNHRVLLWQRIPTPDNTAPDYVLGQDDFTTNVPNNVKGSPGVASATSLLSPAGVAISKGTAQRYLAVADTGNSRVLLWDLSKITNHAAADFVVGQPDASASTPGGVLTDNRLAHPQRLAWSGSMLYVADDQLGYVLGYGGLPANAVVPVVSLGNLGTDQILPTSPRGVTVDEDGRLVVADTYGQRELVWSQAPTAGSPAADWMVGVSISSATNRMQVNQPAAVLVHNQTLFVSSALQNRILYWTPLPSAQMSSIPATGILGQDQDSGDQPNVPAYDLQRIRQLSAPGGMTAVGSRLFIADTLNNRVIVTPLP